MGLKHFILQKKGRALRGLLAFLLALLLAAALAPPVNAAQATTDPTRRAVDWLRAQVPEPGPGDETLMMLLLQGGYATPGQAYCLTYMDALLNHVGSGGAEEQSREASARQAFVLACMGVDITRYALPLWEALGDISALEAEGFQAMRWALMLFALPSVPAPEGVEPAALAAALCARANTDGGFGAEGSEALPTAQALQALAPYGGTEGGVYDVLLNAQFWMQQRAGTGVYYQGKAPSPAATAEAVIAVSCLGYDPAFIGLESPSMVDALKVFQTEDGPFRPNPDSEAEIELTALCALALAAKNRYDLAQKPIFDISGVSPLEPERGEAPASGDTGAVSAAHSGPEKNFSLAGLALPRWALPLGIGLAVVLLVLIVATALTSGRKKRQGRKKHENSPSNDEHGKYIYRK